jgi:hypothetical protein
MMLLDQLMKKREKMMKKIELFLNQLLKNVKKWFLTVWI